MMKDLQAKHKEWCEKNFGGNVCAVHLNTMTYICGLAETVGKVAHHALKSSQGIRGNFHLHASEFLAELALLGRLSLQEDGIKAATAKEPECSILQALLGVIEEVGELAWASMCPDDTTEDRIDAVGDIVLYLLDYCNKAGIDFEDAVRVTAEKVHARDWVKNPVNGEVG